MTLNLLSDLSPSMPPKLAGTSGDFAVDLDSLSTRFGQDQPGQKWKHPPLRVLLYDSQL